MKPTELEEGDDITFATDALRGKHLRVESVEVEDIGITETFAVALSADAEEVWTVVGTTSDNVHTLARYDDGSDESYRITDEEILVVT